MRGVPIRLEIGPRDIENNQAVLVRRDTGEKITVSIETISENINQLLDNIQKNMYNECVKRNKEKTSIAVNLDEFIRIINEKQGYIKTMWCGSEECENKIKELTGAHSRCIPFKKEHISNSCIVCGKPANTMVVWGRQY